MESQITYERSGKAKRPSNQLSWLNEVEKSLLGSSLDTYVGARFHILAMTKVFIKHDAVALVEYQHSRPPTHDVDHNKLTEGVPKKQATEAIDWRPEGKNPIKNLYDVLMCELRNKFQ